MPLKFKKNQSSINFSFKSIDKIILGFKIITESLTFHFKFELIKMEDIYIRRQSRCSSAKRNLNRYSQSSKCSLSSKRRSSSYRGPRLSIYFQKIRNEMSDLFSQIDESKNDSQCESNIPLKISFSTNKSSLESEKSIYVPKYDKALKRRRQITAESEISTSDSDKEEMIEQKQGTFGRGRYPIRNRVPRIRHWLNEKIIYDEAGNFLSAERAKKGEKNFIKKGNKRKKPNPNIIEEVEGSLLIADALTGQDILVHYNLFFRNKNASFIEEDTIKTFKVFSNSEYELRQISFPKNKGLTFPQTSASLRGTVLRAERNSFQLTLGGSTFNISQWDSFIIPVGSDFSLFNLSTKISARIQLYIYLN